MKLFSSLHPKIPAALAEGAVRPHSISPAPEWEEWLDVPPLISAFAWRLVTATIDELESLPSFVGESPLKPDWAPWRRLKDALLAADQLWIFSSPEEFWRTGHGSWGILLVRDGLPFDHLEVASN